MVRLKRSSSKERITPLGSLQLVSFASRTIFFKRTAADHAWDGAARTLDANDPLVKPAHAHRPYDVDFAAASRNHLPSGLMRPILAVPVGDRLRCLGLALYGPHATGNALSHEERFPRKRTFAETFGMSALCQ